MHSRRWVFVVELPEVMHEPQVILLVHVDVSLFNAAIQGVIQIHRQSIFGFRKPEYAKVWIGTLICWNIQRILGVMQQTAHHTKPMHTARFAHPRRNVAALGIHAGNRVADFGSGSGAYVFHFAELLMGSGTVYAIDVQRELLRRIANEATKRGYKNIEIICADLEIPRASKLADGSVDFVLISNLLFQVPDKLPVLREARRIVKGHGHVGVIDWSESFGGMGPVREEVVKKDAALQLAEKAGLSLVREFDAGAHHYGLILKPIPIV